MQISRYRLWLNDLAIEVSLLPVDTLAQDLRNGCLGRAVLKINTPKEKLLLDGRTITIMQALKKVARGLWRDVGMPETTTAVADSTTNSFATAMAQAAHQLDHDGRLTAENARILRRVIAATPREHRLYVAMEPERY
nr:hypothetical protein [Candidatus Tectomicrobia bacterium]